jgi:hypothetical protein
MVARYFPLPCTLTPLGCNRGARARTSESWRASNCTEVEPKLGEVRVRSGIGQVLDRTPLARSAIRSSIVVEQHGVSLRLAIVGGQADASRLVAELRHESRCSRGVEPTVEVTAVPDASSLRQRAQA